MISLLLINYEYPPVGGGAGNATYYLGRALAARGCRVGVLTARFRGLPAAEEREGVRVIRVPALRRREDRSSPLEMTSFMASALPRVRRVARETGAQASLAFLGIPSGPVAWWLKRRAAIPYLVLLRGGDVPGFMPAELALYHRLALPVIRRIWRDAAAVVANSHGLKRTAAAGLAGFEIRVIPNGVDTNHFSPGPAGAPREPRQILFSGRLSLQKDLATLLRALALLSNPPPYELALAGDGPERPCLERLARDLGLDRVVRFLGWTPRAELPARYRTADLFVMPSRDEGMPNSVLEAMASGLPVVATAVPGNEELVLPGVNGVLVPPGDPERLAAALERLLADPDLRRRMGAESRAMAIQRDWDRVAAAYLALLGPLTGE
jgi:glycosyltransferase involved in cell wall biosynthesis